MESLFLGGLVGRSHATLEKRTLSMILLKLQYRLFLEKNLLQQAINNLVRCTFVAALLASAATSFGQDPPPSNTSYIGEVVTNPAINPVIGTNITTVNGLETWETVPGDITTQFTQFVFTEDRWAFMVQPVGVRIYKDADLFFDILSITPIDPLNPYTSPIATIINDSGQVMTLSIWLTREQYLLNWDGGESSPGVPQLPIIVNGVNGVARVTRGIPGRGGGWGTLFVPAGDGRQGGTAPGITIAEGTNNQDILATTRIGLEMGTTGGNGGRGGNSYINVWSPGNGGNGGVGGTVVVTNNAQVATQSATIDQLHGIFAFSQSGSGGAAGTGVLAPSGGTGGDAPDGGNVTVTNNALVSTESRGGIGIYALSVSGNGGGGGSSWGLVGAAGDGGLAGNGGIVNVTNTSTGTVQTLHDFSTGIAAQSIGGTGGSAGTSGNLLLNLPSQGQAGGNAGQVTVVNDGSVRTEGNYSRGIEAQSNGGGGGDQGGTFGLISLGGQSGPGGNGGVVTVINRGSIETLGIGSTAVYAQSVGGSGGSASDAYGVVALGGTGTGGGNGGAVTVENYGTISTLQGATFPILVRGSKGIFAQSVGGGGGEGGSSGGMVSIGGRGGAGGFGSLVQVTNGGSITTFGDNSGGIFAQSVGGGGGDGGSSNSVGVFGGYSMGGAGGAGGVGGNVNVALQGGDISTNGIRSKGIMAQSVGGGGGTGGGSVQATVGVFGAAAVNIGGNGGAASAGGNVTLTASTLLTNIQTQGKYSQGVFLQSVGGSGGDGGLSVAVALAGGPAAGSIAFSQGGNGGAGGSAGIVRAGEFDVSGNLISTGFNGNIQTDGEFSTGFFAHSVGGGGGNGGLSISAAGAGGAAFAGAVAIGLGGSGGGAGHGGVVQIGTQGNITTLQDKSIGLLAQSVGGGGGNGGASIAGTIAGAAGVAAGVQVAIGGSGGGGGNGGSVTLATRSSRIETTGSDSEGIVVQSAGGGGGTGGYNISGGAAGGTGAGAVSVGIGGSGGDGGNGGSVFADLQSDVVTFGDTSAGIIAQSNGKGGGIGGYNIAVTGAGAAGGAVSVAVGLGGSGGGGGSGGQVTLTSTGSISTAGFKSNGITAQSIGGGGGTGGYNIVVGGAGASTGSGAVAVGLGGSGGVASHGGLVIAASSGGLISTSGSESIGVLAQSVGGGGGDGGYNIVVAGTGAGVGSAGVAVGLGGTGGGGGNGGEVRLTVNNDIETTGDKSGGVVAQSVGKGGGVGGYNISVAAGAGLSAAGGGVAVGLGGSGGGGGDGGKVTLTSNGLIHTVGDKSNAFTAQSIGGGGGTGGYNVSAAAGGGGVAGGAVSVGLGGSGAVAGHGGVVEANVTGHVWTEGQNSIGILAQSVGGGGGDGGYNVAATGAFGATAGGGVSVGLGGSGGAGGNGDSVTLAVGTEFLANTISISGLGSMGIVAQSIGGGGGNGGFNVSAALSGAGTGAAAVGVGLGGSGGAGGNAGEVNSTVFANIVNSPDAVGFLSSVGAFDADEPIDYKTASGGLLAQSVGGGGGNGGFNVTGVVSLSASGAGAVAVGIGGMGGDGGSASKVTNSFTGTVETYHVGGFGIAAQSLGGSGGIGGMNFTGAISAATTGSGAVAFGLGGFGGGGGDAGEVNNTVNSRLGFVHTLGNDAIGILAQSVGGGGGVGGTNITGIITGLSSSSGGVGIGLGGFGGGGGDGKLVLNHVTGGVVTEGANSQAVLAQSVGGSGGAGGMNVTGAVNLSKSGGGTLGFGMGGFGGYGGNAGAVESTVTTADGAQFFMTSGESSTAIVAQSVGGAGGVGGLNVTGAVSLSGGTSAAIGVGLGGFGGGAGNGSSVLLDVTGNVLTRGNDSHGLMAQSVGGSGGAGGVNITGSLAGTSSGSAGAISIGVGGFGGDGGNAGAVTLNYAGTVIAAESLSLLGAIGKGSHGIVGQSLGGGGGIGGMNVSGGIGLIATSGYGAVFGVGGFGGAGGNADTVDVTVTGGESITTYGQGKSAIFAQSLGGGGGDGGINVSGGITAGNSLFFGVGGFAGDAGTAKKVTVNAATDVTVYQRESLAPIDPDETPESMYTAAGVLAQSIGGGGGNGGMNVTGGIAFSSSTNTLTFGMGGFGGAGAAAGDVDLTLVGDANTTGQYVHGILAQSIGGGGGNGGINVSGQISAGSGTDIAIVAGVGGNGGTGADAGLVGVNHTGSVTTFGDNARAVFAQSIGGGGGVGGMNVTGLLAYGASPITVGVGGTGGDAGGTSGAVTVTRGSAELSTGKLTTTGIGAHGIEASSIGGGGGDAGMNFVGGVAGGITDRIYAASFLIGGSGGNSGSAGAVSVNNFSEIVTTRAESNGVLAQSIGSGGGNGNYNMGLTLALAGSAKDTISGSLTIGGQPGDGGDATTVYVNQVGSIGTVGDLSNGVVAQSIGGGGGNIGLDLNITMGLTKVSKSLDMTLGKVGGTGGTSGVVTLVADGTIHTRGKESVGLLAQSIGGGGGTSSSTSVILSQGSTADGKLDKDEARVSIGRQGGEGGGSNDVTVNAVGYGVIVTEGARSHAIVAQSVGGGGGLAGSGSTLNFVGAAPTIGVAVGGAGGLGGVSGKVNVTSTVEIYTGYSAILDSPGADTSIGILAQSIGGGGGVGGDAWTGGIGYLPMSVSVAVGGSGGAGNASETVDVSSSGFISTNGVNSYGILAQSIGGGGGNAGTVINGVLPILQVTPDSGATIAAVQVGGVGGDGSISREVTVTNTGGIETKIGGSIGILAQSIGGGGGNASSIYSGTLVKTAATSVFSFSIGATGGTGGVGSDVLVQNLSGSRIDTYGDLSHGIYAMSLGGGGGTGSDVLNINLGLNQSNDDANNIGVTFGLGGTGGEGGSSGRVDVLNEGTIRTFGEKAHGVIAQSIGGGGGDGGYSITGNVQYGGKGFDTTAPTGVFSIGGRGGAGNKASDVTVTNSGLIEVRGNSSYGVYAQSVGGGGGNGGFAAALTPNQLTKDPFRQLTTIGLGGFGGSGADGGNVTVDNTGGTIRSYGDDSIGIYAQSIGGGGGTMGWAVSSPAATAANLLIQQTIGGGSGLLAGDGAAGIVDVHAEGNIEMLGARSKVKKIQSVSGGGGDIELFLDVSEQAVVIGQDGIIIPTEPTIASWGVLAELGMNLVNHNDWIGTTTGKVTDWFAGGATTVGEWSTASQTQSIGGGGGTATENFVVDTLAEGNFGLELGGVNIENGDGGEINSERYGEVTTLGDDSIGTEVQSIGGGGGSAIIGVETILLPGHTGGSAIANVVLGGDATIGSDGGTIDSIYAGDVLTLGDRSPGLLLQSIGAGGGKATMLGFDSIDVGIGGQNAASGNGDNINVSNVGSIETDGALSHGVILQTIGGGGGAFFSDSSDISVAANADNSGNGGDINFAQTGDVIALGDGSIGILAQSLGGGGGFINRLFMDTAGGAGTSGAINLNVNGDVAATAENGVGIFAQSRGATSQGNIDIQFAADKRIVVGDSGVGVEISGGKDNTFVNDGIVFAATTIGSPDGIVVRGSEGNETITNNGTFYGNIDLGTGSNLLTSADGASVYSGHMLFIGDGADQFFTNRGSLSLGDTTASYTTDLTGSYVQSATGQLDISIDATNDGIDLLHITHTANLEGKLNIIMENVALLKAGQRDLTYLRADEGILNQNMELVAPVSAVAQYSFAAEPAAPVSAVAVYSFAAEPAAPPTSAAVSMSVSFSGFGTLNNNQTSIGSYVARVQAAGSSSEMAPLITGLFALPTENDLAAAYDSMSPEVYTSAQRNLELSSSRFIETMFGCNQLESSYKFNADGEEIATNRTAYQTMEFEASKGAGEGKDAAKKESHLFWVNTTADFYTSSQTSQYMGFTADTIDFSAGVQWALTDEWYVGAALGHTTYTTNFSDGISAMSEGTSSQIGAYVAKLFGPTKVSLGIAGGVSEIDVDRSNIFSATGPASGELDSAFFATRFRVSHNFDLSDWYIRPFLDLGFSSIHNNSLTETGAGAMNLVIDAGTYNVFTVSPTLQVGWEIKSGSLSIRPNASIGYTRYSNSAPSFSATLQGGPGGVSSFDVSGLNDLDYLNTSGGIDLAFSNSVVFQFVYSGQFSQNTSADNFQLKIVFPF